MKKNLVGVKATNKQKGNNMKSWQALALDEVIEAIKSDTCDREKLRDELANFARYFVRAEKAERANDPDTRCDACEGKGYFSWTHAPADDKPIVCTECDGWGSYGRQGDLMGEAVGEAVAWSEAFFGKVSTK